MVDATIVEQILNHDGTREEHQIVYLIHHHLITADQSRQLGEFGLTISDCLNGRYGRSAEDFVMQMYRDWNSRMRRKAFLDGTAGDLGVPYPQD